MRFERQPVKGVSVRNLYLLSLFNVFLIVLVFLFFLPKFTGSAGLTLALPRALSSEVVSSNGAVISILKDDTIYLDSKKTSFDELKLFFAESSKKGSFILIKADHTASVGTLVRVWDLLREAGASQINIATNE